MNRSSTLKRHPKPKRSDAEKALAERWAAEARGRSCVVCAAPPPSRGHHVLYQQHLRDVCHTRELDYELLRWDLRNMLAVCTRCHANHHSASRRIPRRLLGAGVFELAGELGLESRLDRTYPEGS